ncbi:MAG: hypothetical protein OEU32_14570 [Acidimicrobiia bacterium]|nr:hypothetical protein [Acidimicrobiia bacterium]
MNGPATAPVQIELHGRRRRAVRRATGPGAARLRTEIELLRRCASPSVVSIAEVDDDGTSVSIEFDYISDRTLATWPVPEVADAAQLIAPIAEAVTEIHGCGVVHGNLSADHVLIGTDRRPVLCGFGRAATVADADPVVDTAALGRTLVALLDRVDNSRQAGPWGTRLLRGGRRAERSLRDLAQRATSGAIDARSFADEAAAIATSAGPATRRLHESGDSDDERTGPSSPSVDDPPDSTVPPTRVWRTRPTRVHANERDPVSRWLIVAVAVTIVATVSGFAAARSGGADRSTDPVTVGPIVDRVDNPSPQAGAATTSTDVRAPAEGERESEPTAARSDVVPTAETTAPPASGEVEVCAFDVDTTADGCADRVSIADGVVTVNDRRYAVGVAGDRLAVGDWDCDGLATVAVVRPSSGEIFIFDAWAQRGELRAPLVAHLTRPAAPVAIELGDGCHDLAVDHEDGTWTYSGTAT